jgi:dCTP diphosphatase
MISDASSSIRCIEGVRSYCSNFVKEREWKRFHTPVNIMLALNGEIGELSEIFQWKGEFDTSIINNVENNLLFNEKERINIGEELSDVFIYTTRLSDLCNIDLAQSVKLYLTSQDPININNFFNCMKSTTENGNNWDTLTFDEIQKLIEKSLSNNNDIIINNDSNNEVLKSVSNVQSFLSLKSSLNSIKNQPRRLCLSLQNSAAKASSLFCNHHEKDSMIGLNAWNKQSVAELAKSLSSIIVILSIISKAFGYSLGTCITEKFVKNAAKYPVNKVKGSSAKYTHYQNMNENKLFNKIINSKITLISFGLICGIILTKFHKF